MSAPESIGIGIDFPDSGVLRCKSWGIRKRDSGRGWALEVDTMVPELSRHPSHTIPQSSDASPRKAPSHAELSFPSQLNPASQHTLHPSSGIQSELTPASSLSKEPEDLSLIPPTRKRPFFARMEYLSKIRGQNPAPSRCISSPSHAHCLSRAPIGSSPRPATPSKLVWLDEDGTSFDSRWFGRDILGFRYKLELE